jgi:hypothetical protein
VHERVAEALDATPALTPVGTTPVGALWRVPSYAAAANEVPELTKPAVGILIGQGLVIALAVLLAIPTGRRRRVVTETAPIGEDPADTFAEDDNA